MKAPHDASHAVLLERALTCTSAERSSPHFDALRACTTCALRLAELDQLELDLLHAAAIEREVLTQAAANIERADVELVRRAFARHEAQRGDVAHARVRRGWIAAAALLALALGVFAWRIARAPHVATGPPPEIQLGSGDTLRVHAPVRNADGSATFAWDASPPRGLAFRLLVRSADPATPPYVQDVETDRCVVPASTVAAWSAAGDVTWRVEVYDSSGSALGSSDEQRWSPR